jgi:hypothetical protein
MKCQICKRTLSATDSILKGIGPECAGKYANGIQAAGSSFAQIEKLEALDAPTVNRWISCAKQAIGRNRIQEAKDFIAAAEKAAALNGGTMTYSVLGNEKAADVLTDNDVVIGSGLELEEARRVAACAQRFEGFIAAWVVEDAAELKHVFIPSDGTEPAESYDEFTCICGIVNQVFDYAGETHLPCECGQLIMVSEAPAPFAMAA